MMARALALAGRGRPRAHPNPLVGCVVARRGRVVGEGAHVFFGGPHAEAVALAAAGDRARGADVYVTLEPCPHWGKTPPCAEALVRAGVRRVAAAVADPAEGRKGRGLALLRRAGVRVETGLMAKTARELNRPFFSLHERGRPWVVWKIAQTLDGKIASRAGVSRWITGPAARRMGHDLRAQSDAVMVGAETLRRDDPGLTAHGRGPDPLRLVVSGSLNLPVQAKLWRGDNPGWIVTGEGTSRSLRRKWERRGARVLPVAARRGDVDMRAALAELGRMGCAHILVEGGGRLGYSLFSAGLVDEAYIVIAPSFLGGTSAPTGLAGEGWAAPEKGPRLRAVTVERAGEDIVIHGRAG
jgi:diaminohydroxyphosphoribosylaminopyrimidine deaminase/5-amino-6-(5-phosphoribosylamino)uracil reductase